MSKGGVYLILNHVKGKGYIGSSVSLNKRWVNHKYHLKKGDHRNILLQRAWNKYGPNAFSFHVLEEVPNRENLATREQGWLDICLPLVPYYNIKSQAYHNYAPGKDRLEKMRERMIGNKMAAGKGHPQTEETKKRISEKLKGTRHSEESYKRQSEKITGRKHSPESIEKMRRVHLAMRQKQRELGLLGRKVKKGPGKRKGEASHFAKLTEEKVIQIRRLHADGGVGVELARQFGVNKTVISAIVNRKTWKHI